MSQLALVRAEIKAWERDFAATHRRDPSVHDIRDQPHIAEKYKLYKKLSRAGLPAPKSRPAESLPPPGFNPFSPTKKTPAKNTRTALSPAASSSHLPATSAVSRARKRLRGEPVSPSPSKPKRQRTRSHVLPPSSDSEHESDQELPHCDFTPSFVADSPVKAPAGGKSFKLLFDDALPALSVPNKPLLNSSLNPTKGPEHRVSRVQAKLSTQIFSTKDLPPASALDPAPSPITPKISSKRALDTDHATPLQLQYPLVPPSPPLQDTISRDTGKAKGKATAGRKRVRVEQESDQDADSTDDFSLKVATVRPNQSKHRHPDDLEWDPLLHLGARSHDPAAEVQFDANRHAPGTFSVDLPDKFRRVLAISPPRTRNNTQDRVVRGLLYGDRVAHYDPCRGGDIWDAGETDEGALGDAEAEDDWEGEPVPWEVGEL